MLAVAGTGFLMPIWLEAIGFDSPPPIANVTGPLLFWHLVYGVVLGAVYYALHADVSDRRTSVRH